MKCRVGKSEKSNIKEGIEEATKEINNPKLIIFSSDVANFEEYTKQLSIKFPKCIIIGTSTYISLCKDGVYHKGVVVAAMEEGIECYGDVLEKIDRYPLIYVERIENCVKKLSHTENTVCLEFTNGLINSEESVLTTLNTVLENKKIPVFGGSAGDDLQAGYTLVSYNGKVYKEASVFVLIHNTKGKVKIYRENIYKPMKKFHVATKVDSFNRIVYEFDNRPAAQVMAEDLGISVNELPKHLDYNPLGRVMGGDIYITANKEVLKNNAMAFHARVYKNTQMVLLEPDNYHKINEETINKIQSDISKPSFAVVIHCLARSLLYEGNGDINNLVRKLGNAIDGYIGISGYGEQKGTINFNQTMILAVFE